MKNLVSSLKETKDDWNNAKVIEELTDDYNLNVIAQRKIAERFIITYLKKHVFVKY